MAAVTVLLPDSSTLAFCQHHFNANKAALQLAGAVVLPDLLVDSELGDSSASDQEPVAEQIDQPDVEPIEMVPTHFVQHVDHPDGSVVRMATLPDGRLDNQGPGRPAWLRYFGGELVEVRHYTAGVLCDTPDGYAAQAFLQHGSLVAIRRFTDGLLCDNTTVNGRVAYAVVDLALDGSATRIQSWVHGVFQREVDPASLPAN